MPDWPSSSRFAGIVAANDKGFVTERGEELTLLSFDLVPIKRVTLPQPPANQYTHERYWNPRPDWSGKRVLLLGQVFSTRGPWLWIDAENLEVLKSWQDVLTGDVAVSSDRLVMGTRGQHFGDPPPTLEIAVPGGDWKPLSSTTNPSTPQFVGPDLLYFHRYSTISLPAPAQAFLIRTDGSEIFRLETTRKGWGPGRAAVSRVGNRFVILEGEMKGSHPALDIGGQSVLKGVLVYDPPFHVPSYTLTIRDSKVTNASAALSPDGRHLAVLGYREPLLEVFELPPAN
jgi:hypothetical protein